jgi:Cd2+/Zn2+-exporting ATPase
MDADELLSWAAAAESRSTHPIAGSIRSAAVEKGIEPQGEIGACREYRARGVRAVVDGSTVLAGSDKMMHEWNIEHSDCEAAGSAVYVAVDGCYAGYLTVGDEVKDGVREAIAELGRLGVHRTALISGDEKVHTGRIAEAAGIDEWHAELLPEEKVAAVEELGRRFPGKSVVFVGDGVNDAPVLARSAAGISMGGLGSDAAIEAADIVLMKDDLRALPAAIRIARRTKRIVVQNIAGALTVKLLFLALGAAGMVTMWGAVFADVGVTLLAVFNSLRALAQPRLLR